jgi:hypothetical protein
MSLSDYRMPRKSDDTPRGRGFSKKEIVNAQRKRSSASLVLTHAIRRVYGLLDNTDMLSESHSHRTQHPTQRRILNVSQERQQEMCMGV